MSYQIVRTDGDYIATVLDDQTNTEALPITLFGKGLTNYGEGLNENFVFMLENFAGPFAPQRATPGMVWFNATTQSLQVLNSAQVWHSLAYTDAGDQTFNGSITVQDTQGDGATLGNGGILTLVRAVTNDGPEIDLKRAWSGPTLGQIKLVAGTIGSTPVEFVQIKDNLLVTGFLRVTGNAEIDGNAEMVGDLNVLGRLQHNGYDVVTTQEFDQSSYVTRQEIGLDMFWSHNDFNIADYLLKADYTPDLFVKKTDIDLDLYVKSAGGTMSGDLVIANTSDSNNLRLVQGDYGLIHRIDNQNYYLLVTNQQDPLGTWTAARPFVVNLPTGSVTMNNLNVYGNGNVWTSSNFDPTAYLPLTGGTLIQSQVPYSGTLIATGNFIQCQHAQNPIVFAHKPGVAAGGVAIMDSNDIALVQCDGVGGIYKELVGYTTVTGHLRFNAPIEDAIGYGSQLQLVDPANQITVHLHNDGQNFYLLTTNHYDPYGSFNGLRPLQFNLSSGDVSTYHNFSAGGYIFAGGDITAFSDARIKENVQTIGDALGLVSQMRGVRFTRTADASAGVGVIAQEVQAVVPEVVHATPDGTLSVAYGNLVGVLIEAVKELSAMTTTLAARIDALEGACASMVGG